MTRSAIARGAFAAVVVLLAVVAGFWILRWNVRPVAAPSPAIPPSPPPVAGSHPPAETYQGFLYGRITTVDGATYEGRLRWGGGGEEAFWSNYFIGSRHANPWFAQVPPERLPAERRPIEIFGVTIGHKESQINLVRQLMARFGEIARIEARGNLVRVTLKSGTVVDLDRSEASDFDDGVRVWDGRRGVVDLDSLRIRSIELLPTPALNAVPGRLHGTVHTRQGDFTGFVQWNREEGVGTDELDGRTPEGKRRLRFDTLRSIARRSPESSLVTLLDGREIVLSDTADAGDGNRGIYVEDPRYGRVLISWDAFERVDFSPGGSGPGYGDFPPGRPLTGSVTTRAGRRLAGRLVYDLDESETTDTLDAQDRGVHYTLPFGLIAAIVPPGPDERGRPAARVTLQNGEELHVERTGDLGDTNAGLLIFVEGRQRPGYVSWTEVKQIDLDRPPAPAPAVASPGSTGVSP